MSEPLLVGQALTKSFPGVKALSAVDLTVSVGEIVGLVGQNGSGKSTLLKIIAGLHRPDSGTLTVRGRAVSFSGPAAARREGIGMVFQEQSLIGNLSVAENILLGLEGETAAHGRVHWSRLYSRAQEYLDRLDSTIDVRAQADQLSQGERQVVELAKSLATEGAISGSPLILLDEATSVLSRSEIESLFTQLERLKEHAGIVFVSHRLDEVLRLADRVYVLKDGECVAQRERGGWTEDEFFGLMVGSGLNADYFRIGRQIDGKVDGPAVLELEGLGGDGFSDVSLSAARGEVLGICGVEGSGRAELLKALCGAGLAKRGTMRLNGRPVTFHSPSQAVEQGIGYVPAERTRDAALLDMSVGDNITISRLRHLSAGPLINRRTLRRVGLEWIEKLGIRTTSPDVRMRNLSGGNQQKAVFARWLVAGDLKLLLLDHPTRGLDVGAKRNVYDLIRDISDGQGVTVLLVSDSLEETIGLAHRVMAMRDGQVTATFEAPASDKPNPSLILEAMV
jgi:ribose transport system ATP-binding protein